MSDETENATKDDEFPAWQQAQMRAAWEKWNSGAMDGGPATTPTAALVEEAETHTTCDKCGAAIVKYSDFTGLLPTEDGMRSHTPLVCERTQELRRAEAERDELRATVTRLNRRAQTAEAGVRDNVEASKAAGKSMGRTLANAAAAMYRRRAEKAEAERDAQHAEVLRLTGERDEARLRLKASEEGLRVVTMEREPRKPVRRAAAALDQSSTANRDAGTAAQGREMTLRAPFPWFGGKSRAASIIWERFGDVANYIEPFAGSLAVLLARPTPPRIETVNDLDCMVANFWRATQKDPEAVAKFADWPVNEADLHARHRWLVAQIPMHRERMKTDPDYYDAKIAGEWVWGLCQWIGTGWCAERNSQSQRGHGHSSGLDSAIPAVPHQLPHLGDAGMGIHRKLPHLGDAGMGIHRKLPHLGNAGRGTLIDTFAELAARLRRVRVACGDWQRVVSPAVAERHGMTGILLDPPYQEGEMEYATGEDRRVSAEVAAWARENGDNPLLRIALCGLEGEHVMPSSWACVPWVCRKGYANSDNLNRKRERIWFSPHCLRPDKGQLALLEAS